MVDLEFEPRAVRGLREYVRLVAAALGLRGQSWTVQCEPPANVYLALDDRLPLYRDRDVALIWDEEHGWSLELESNHSGDLQVLAYLGDDVLPAPEAVARAVRRSFVEMPSRGDLPVYRRSGDDDDLHARLIAYAVPFGLPREAPLYYAS